MKHQAEGLKVNGVCGFAFTPSTTAFDFPSLPVIPTKMLRGDALQTRVHHLAS